MGARAESLFDEIRWQDPLDGSVLEPIVTARTPGGVPLLGALRRRETSYGYPIVDAVARLTPELAVRHRDWLRALDLEPPPPGPAEGAGFQEEGTVDSFGFQWSWNSAMRSERDLKWRVADRFGFQEERFRGAVVMDAGAGAGDQSRWLLERGARVVSVDLSSAIDVVARKLRMNPGWVGIQGDLTALPLESEQFDLVYCEGVIQHTRDSERTVSELCRVLCGSGGTILATHYSPPEAWHWKVRLRALQAVRSRLSQWDRYKLLWMTGTLAALAYVPVVRFFMRKSTLVQYYDLMPDFKTTWTNTFDAYGNHAFQRAISSEEFLSYFRRIDGVSSQLLAGGVVVARKGG